MLHKWLADRNKAKRSLSQDDITHWLRVYASLAATQKLMQQVDEAIEAHGGWPGAFSQKHPPPDAATLADEQKVQKERLKAQKKAATATKKRAASASPTGASSLFDFDDDLDGLAEASGAPPAQNLGPPLPRQRVANLPPAPHGQTTSPTGKPCVPSAPYSHAKARSRGKT